MLVLFLIVQPVITCGKKKLDLAQFEAPCNRVVKCDRTFQKMAILQGGNVKKVCQKFLAKIAGNKKFSAFVPKLTKCLSERKCEDVSMTACLKKATTGMKMLMP